MGITPSENLRTLIDTAVTHTPLGVLRLHTSLGDHSPLTPADVSAAAAAAAAEDPIGVLLLFAGRLDELPDAHTVAVAAAADDPARTLGALYGFDTHRRDPGPAGDAAVAAAAEADACQVLAWLCNGRLALPDSAAALIVAAAADSDAETVLDIAGPLAGDGRDDVVAAALTAAADRIPATALLYTFRGTAAFLWPAGTLTPAGLDRLADAAVARQPAAMLSAVLNFEYSRPDVNPTYRDTVLSLVSRRADALCAALLAHEPELLLHAYWTPPALVDLYLGPDTFVEAAEAAFARYAARGSVPPRALVDGALSEPGLPAGSARRLATAAEAAYTAAGDAAAVELLWLHTRSQQQ